MSAGTRLFVGNLPANVKDLENNLKQEFSHYGTVHGVELKCKKDVDGKEVGQFAFVTLQSDTHRVNQCIHEFSAQEFHGQYLTVSVAKESFLDRLKREREDNERRKGKETVSFEPPKNGHIEKINIKLPEKKKASDYEERKEIYAQNQNSSRTYNEEEKYYNRTESNDVVNNQPATQDIVESVVDKKEPKRPKRPKNRVKNIPPDYVPDVKSKDVKKLTPADEKRLKSMQNMRNAYNQKKSLVKMALSSVDKKVNKIVFDDDGEQIECVKNEDVLTNTNGKRKRQSNGEVSAVSKKMKTNLFDGEDGDEELNDYNFQVKEHFQGEAGQKLLELQARYQSDKRFVLDERFTEDHSEMTTNNNKDFDDAIEEEEDDHMDEGGVEGLQDEEKKREIEILESILGTSVRTSKRIRDDHQDGKKQLPIKTMLRYDPTRPDHDKFMSKSSEIGETTGSKKSKKEKKEAMERKAEEEQQKAAAPVVSQERYYKVNQSLKQAIESEDKKPFSLLSMFGKPADNNEESKNENVNDSYRAEPIEKSKKDKYPIKESNPFKYDSDSDDEKEESKTNSHNQMSEERENQPNTVLVNEKFFFTMDDARLQEGVRFFLEGKPTNERSRVELKNLMKKRIKNNIRNERTHHNRMV